MEADSARTPRPGGTLLMVANYAPDVGFAWWLVEHFWVELAKVARDRGLEPVIAYPEEGPVPEAIERAGIETIRLPYPGRSASELWSSLAFTRRQRVRALYLTDRGFANWRYGLFRLLGVRVILNHDHTPGDRPPAVGIKAALKSLRMRIRPATADLQLCVAPIIRDRAIRTTRIPPERAVVVQNGIEPLDCEGAQGYAHAQFGLPPDTRLCVTVGRAHPYKRIDFVIEIARRCILERGARDLAFLYCGDGPDMPRLRARVREAGLEPHFLMPGRRSDVARLLCSADYALHAARGEAFSLAVVEYMSAGLAVLVPDLPTVCQAVTHERTGMVYRDGDAAEATACLLRLHENPEMARALGRAATEVVRREYSMASMNRSFRATASKALEALR